jgi:hypothetical protein
VVNKKKKKKKIQKQENGQGLGRRKLCKLYRKRERNGRRGKELQGGNM